MGERSFRYRVIIPSTPHRGMLAIHLRICRNTIHTADEIALVCLIPRVVPLPLHNGHDVRGSWEQVAVGAKHFPNQTLAAVSTNRIAHLFGCHDTQSCSSAIVFPKIQNQEPGCNPSSVVSNLLEFWSFQQTMPPSETKTSPGLDHFWGV